MSRARSPRILLAALAVAAASASAVPEARADDASVVARAREQVESGAYPEALRTLAALSKASLPTALAVEAGLIETTAALVARGEEAGQTACAKAVVAAGYDPEVARDQSPKVRAACRAAATKERKARLERDEIALSGLEVAAPEVAWQPVRISASATGARSHDGGSPGKPGSAPMPPAWLRVVARVTSSALEGSFDLVLAPSVEGPVRGTLDPSWIRPKAKLRIELVAQDRFGDLVATGLATSVDVPAAEAAIALGPVPSGAAVSLDGAAVEPGPGGKIPVTPGKHKVAMALGDGSSASTSVEVQRGAVAGVALSPQRTGGPGWAWIAGAGAVTLGAAGAVFLVSSAVRKGEIEDLAAKREPGTMLPATDYAEIAKKDQDRKTFAAVGMGLAIGAGVAAAAAVTIRLWPASAPAKRAAVTVQPIVGPGYAGLAGSF